MVQVLPVGWMVSLGLLQFLLVYVAANEPIDPICQSSSEYLDAMYRCRPSDFQVMSFCAASAPYELACNRSKRIAVLSASLGPSQNNQCNQEQTVVFAGSAGHTGTSDGECCLLPAVEVRCKGKGKCSLSSDIQQSVDARQCSPPPPPPSSRKQQRTLIITVVFICVSRETMKDINRDKSSPDAFCDGQSEPTVDEVPSPATDNHLLHQPADIFQPSGQLTTTSATRRLESTNSAGLASSVSESSPSDVASPVMHRRIGTADWIWSFIYVKENMDRFLIYLFLSVAIGVICVLLVVILGLCFGDRLKHRKRSSSSDVIHRKQSSTQTTTDVTSALIASNHSPGIEMVRYVPTDSSLRSQPLMRTSTGTQSTPSTTAGNMVHFAASGSSTDGLGSTDSFTGNGGPRVIQGMNLPQYQISNASRDSLDGGGAMARGRSGVEGSDDYRSNTIGRFYTNPYRHDSYRSDGYRTLQHK